MPESLPGVATARKQVES